MARKPKLADDGNALNTGNGDGENDGFIRSDVDPANDAETVTRIDPASIGAGSESSGGSPSGPDESGNGGNSRTHKRGRPKGSRNYRLGKAATAGNLDLNAVEGVLFSIHSLLATTLKVPELELEHEEAKRLAEAVSNVERHYRLPITQKMIDWAALSTVCFAVYGTRIAAYNMRRSATKNPGPRTAAQSTAPAAQREFVEVPGVGQVEVTGVQPSHLNG